MKKEKKKKGVSRICAENTELSGGGPSSSDVGTPLFGNNLDRRVEHRFDHYKYVSVGEMHRVRTHNTLAGWPSDWPTGRLVG